MIDHCGVSWKDDPKRDDHACVQEALSLAIRGGLEFKKADMFIHVGSPEHYYPTAIEAGNTSACEAIEMAIGRKPWVWRGKRLCRSSGFLWRNHEVVITSFDDEKDQIIARAYKNQLVERGHGEHAYEDVREYVAKRYTISHADFDEVAKRYRTFARRQEEFEQMGKWLVENGHAGINLNSAWHWTKAEHAEIQNWIRERKDAKAHRKTRVGNDPLPAFVQQAHEDMEADRVVRREIHQQMIVAFGEEPKYSDHKGEWEFKRAKAAWEAKRLGFTLPLLSSRPTVIGRLEAAVHAWAAANFDGQPSDYLVDEVAGKSKRRQKSPTA
jgi:hypothetical protein